MQSLSGTSDSKPVHVVVDRKKWKLEWHEEFDHGKVPDPSKWEIEQGYKYNHELQFCTNRPENCRIENGKLIIEGRIDNWNGHKITSARINTSGKKSFLYGRIEVRAKLPTGKGTWPAIWTLGEDIGQTGWPACGEIDVMENVGFDPSVIHANIHVANYNHVKKTGKGNHIDFGKPWEDFHVYALEWYKDRLEFFFDDTRYFVFRKESEDHAVWPFDKPQFLILNLAIGGDWGGQQGVDETTFPKRFEVDYVRYFKER